MDVKPISLCDHLLSYKHFLRVTHYILVCSVLAVWFLLQTNNSLHKVAYLLLKTSFTPSTLCILSPFHCRSWEGGGGREEGGGEGGRR